VAISRAGAVVGNGEPRRCANPGSFKLRLVLLHFMHGLEMVAWENLRTCEKICLFTVSEALSYLDFLIIKAGIAHEDLKKNPHRIG